MAEIEDLFIIEVISIITGQGANWGRDPDKPRKFLEEAKLTKLGYFNDQKAKVFQDLKAIGRALGMPTSVLVDGQGCEIATIAGPAEWASDDAVKLIQAAIKPQAAGF